MEYRFLGKTGVQVSKLCMGTMTFGREADKAAAKVIFNRCRDAGINFFDCANVYSEGRAETILGELMSDCRQELVVSSKFGSPMGKGYNNQGGSRRHLVSSLEASLKRLNTDYIDIYFLHRFDEDTPLEETLRALDDVVSQGTVRYIGVSNFAAWQIAKALGISAANGWTPFHCIQPMYNLIKRQAEVEILPLAQSEKLGVISYNPLGGGILSGKYTENRLPDSARLTDDDMYRKRYGDDWMYDIARRFYQFAGRTWIPSGRLGSRMGIPSSGNNRPHSGCPQRRSVGRRASIHGHPNDPGALCRYLQAYADTALSDGSLGRAYFLNLHIRCYLKSDALRPWPTDSGLTQLIMGRPFKA